MKKNLWKATIVCSILGALIALSGMFSPGAPQLAAMAALGLAFSAIPYCLARAVSEIDDMNKSE
ncbi:MAG: hypothetical protein IPN27_00095 [Cellvibrionales bacterium]|nr:hypothetical protein [Cellvibrionales bacterium]